MESILNAVGQPTVNLFVLDIEGFELAVLKSINWEKVNIEVHNKMKNYKMVHANKIGINFMIFILLFMENYLKHNPIHNFSLWLRTSLNSVDINWF